MVMSIIINTRPPPSHGSSTLSFLSVSLSFSHTHTHTNGNKKTYACTQSHKPPASLLLRISPPFSGYTSTTFHRLTAAKPPILLLCLPDIIHRHSCQLLISSYSLFIGIWRRKRKPLKPIQTAINL